MNVMGVQYAGNNLPEANTRNYRVEVKRKEEQDGQLEWLQQMYETYSRHLQNFDKKLKDPAFINDRDLAELRADCVNKLTEIKQKITALSVK